MDSIGTTIRNARKERGLTQQDAARRANLSRAEYQNIEADRANPALSSLDRVLSAVGLTISIERDIDWGRLAALGLPLAIHAGDTVSPSERQLTAALKEAARWYQESPISRLRPREREALESLVLAVYRGWPAVYGRCAAAIPDLAGILPPHVDGRHIKLYRLARSRLGEYL